MLVPRLGCICTVCVMAVPVLWTLTEPGGPASGTTRTTGGGPGDGRERSCQRRTANERPAAARIAAASKMNRAPAPCDVTGFTWNDRVTSRAGAKPALPPWEAVIVQVPGATVVTVAPDTVHTAGVLEVNDTGSPEVADAATVPGVPTLAAGGWLKVIVCTADPALTWNDRVRSRAGAKPALPPWEAVIVQVPGATVVTVAPDTVHTAGVLEVNDTGSPEVADAAKVTGTPTTEPGGGAKEIL